MNSRIIFIGFFLLVCCTSRGRQSGSFKESDFTPVKFNFQKTDQLVFSTPDSLPLAAPLYTFEMDHEHKRIALFDSMTQQFFIFDSHGNFLHMLGREGQGPEEFLMVYGYTFDESGNLIVYDDALKLIKIFDRNYQLIKTTEVKNDQYYLASHKIFARDSVIVSGVLETRFSGPAMRDQITNSTLVGVFSYGFEEQQVFGQYDEYLDEILPSTSRPVIHEEGTKIYTSHSNSYRIQVFDKNTGERSQYFGFKSKHFGDLEEQIDPSEPLEQRFKKGFEESSTRMLHTDNRYLYLFFINGSEEWLAGKDLQTLNYFLMIYDKTSGHFLGEIQLPHRLSYALGNAFYLLEDENPEQYTIGVYEVVTDH